MEFLKIDEVLGNVELREDMMGAEFGCGSADFAIALAKKLSKGMVYAIDIQEEKLSALKGKLSLQKINNVKTVLSDLEARKGSTIADRLLDIVLIPNLLFQASDKYVIINEAQRILKSGGQMAVIDWSKKSIFNAKEILVTPEEVKKIAETFDFSLKKEFAAGDYHYALIFIKK